MPLSDPVPGRNRDQLEPPDPLTAEWLTQHKKLQTPIVSLEETALSKEHDAGLASKCSRVIVIVTPDGQPEHYIAKRPFAEAESLRVIEVERLFYTQIRPRIPSQVLSLMNIPRAVVAFHGERDGDQMIMMEELQSPNWVVADESEGVSMEHCLKVAEGLGKFHAAASELVESNERVRAFLPSGRWYMPQLAKYINHVVKVDDLQEVIPPVALDVFQRLLKISGPEADISCALTQLYEKLQEPPLTICHGDLRPANLRVSGPSVPIAVGAFDFGLVHKGRGLPDFAYFMMLAHPAERRRERDSEMLRCYLKARNNDVDVDQEEQDKAMQEVKEAALCIMAALVFTYCRTKVAEVLPLVKLISAAVEDWNCGTVVEEYEEFGLGTTFMMPNWRGMCSFGFCAGQTIK